MASVAGEESAQRSEDAQHSSDIVRFSKECQPWDEWDKPAKPFHIHGDTWYVGTCGIASILIAREGNNTVIDSGTSAGADVVLANLEALGIDPATVTLLLASHEHFDHVGGMAKLVEATGADLVSSDIAIATMLSGKDHPADPQYGMHASMRPTGRGIAYYTPQARQLLDGFVTPIETPGHSPGAMSWQWESCDETGRCKSIVYADSLSPVSSDEYRFSDHPEYVAEFRAGLQRLREVSCDILLTPHPSHSNMVKRAATGTFEGGTSCAEYADGKERALDERLAKEAEAQ